MFLLWLAFVIILIDIYLFWKITHLEKKISMLKEILGL